MSMCDGEVEICEIGTTFSVHKARVGIPSDTLGIVCRRDRISTFRELDYKKTVENPCLWLRK